jgi:hypothetical protein
METKYYTVHEAGYYAPFAVISVEDDDDNMARIKICQAVKEEFIYHDVLFEKNVNPLIEGTVCTVVCVQNDDLDEVREIELKRIFLY